MNNTIKKAIKINSPHILLALASFGVVVSGCNNVKKIQPDLFTDTVRSKELTEPDKSNNFDKAQTSQSEVNLPVNSTSKILWSTLNRDEQINQIKRIISSYNGELQGLGYSDTGILEVADVYIANANISKDNHLQLTQTLSKLVGSALVVNIQNSRMVDEMGDLETLELSSVESDDNSSIVSQPLTQSQLLTNLDNRVQIVDFSINNNEHVNKIAQIIEMHGAKLQSLGYSGDSELSLSISYYPKKFTMSEFENLEADLEALTGLKVTVFKKSVLIKPL